MNKRTFFKCIAGAIAASVGVAQAKSRATGYGLIAEREPLGIVMQLASADRITKACLLRQQAELDAQLQDVRREHRAIGDGFAKVSSYKGNA